MLRINLHCRDKRACDDSLRSRSILSASPTPGRPSCILINTPSPLANKCPTKVPLRDAQPPAQCIPCRSQGRVLSAVEAVPPGSEEATATAGRGRRCGCGRRKGRDGEIPCGERGVQGAGRRQDTVRTIFFTPFPPVLSVAFANLTFNADIFSRTL